MPRLNLIITIKTIIDNNATAIQHAVTLVKQYINDNGANLSNDDKARVADIITMLTSTENLLGYQAKEINNILRLIAPRIAHEQEINKLANELLPIETPEQYSGLDTKETPDDALSKLKLT